ncbi:serine hydrolase [Bacillus sp. FJAT-49732]|uniref:Serine hydrolase n=1 Tax=Lederbergia citrisecunda TaxID=2833583 RepID=A0A942YQD5_9BACI|nr:serine hydrolase [Lederbergia citrisecunda]MBS4202176.1 serine hydrolase [Lederbergia citrisecunda]
MFEKILIVIIVLGVLTFPLHISAAEDTTPSGISLTNLEAFVDDYAEDYIGKTTAGASIAVLKNNEIVLSKGYGFADIEKEQPMNPSTTVLEWGSITKLFVWVSVMQLVEENELDLHANISDYLPDGFLLNLKYDAPITMLDLMNHQAGFEDYVFDLGYPNPKDVRSLEEGLKIAEPKQVYKPGEVVSYSNYSTSLAALIVENITGEQFYDYVSNHILKRLEMNHSSIHPTLHDHQNLVENKATGYKLVKPATFEASSWFYMSMYPSGGLNGTAEDLAKFAAALMPKEGETSPLFKSNDTLVEMLSQSYSPHQNMMDIAHGFWEYDGVSRGLTHGGNTASFSSNFQIVPEEQFAVIVLTNQASEVEMSYGLIKELVGLGEITPTVEKMPDSKELEGTYITARRMHNGFLNLYYYLIPYKITVESENKIKVSIAGQSAQYLQTSPYLYRLIDGHSLFEANHMMYFHVENGKVQQVSTAISDYMPLPKGKGTLILIFHLVLAIVCIGYLLVSLIVLLIHNLKMRKKERKASSTTRGNFTLHLAGVAMIINIFILIYRLLSNSYRAYSELVIHIIFNYLFTAIAIFSIIWMIIKWRKSNLIKIQKYFYSFSIVSVIIFIYLLVTWQFFA